jgi:hypothetical protein
MESLNCFNVDNMDIKKHKLILFFNINMYMGKEKSEIVRLGRGIFSSFCLFLL